MWEEKKKTTHHTVQGEKVFQEQNTNMVIQDSPLLLVSTPPRLKAWHLLLSELRIIPRILLIISERINTDIMGIYFRNWGLASDLHVSVRSICWFTFFSFFKQAVCLLFQAFSWAATGCRTCHTTDHHFALHAPKKAKIIMAQNPAPWSVTPVPLPSRWWDETGVTCYLIRRHKCCLRSSGNSICFHS